MRGLLRQWCGEDAAAVYDELAVLRAEAARVTGLLREVIKLFRQGHRHEVAKQPR